MFRRAPLLIAPLLTTVLLFGYAFLCGPILSLMLRWCCTQQRPWLPLQQTQGAQ